MTLYSFLSSFLSAFFSEHDIRKPSPGRRSNGRLTQQPCARAPKKRKSQVDAARKRPSPETPLPKVSLLLASIEVGFVRGTERKRPLRSRSGWKNVEYINFFHEQRSIKAKEGCGTETACALSSADRASPLLASIKIGFVRGPGGNSLFASTAKHQGRDERAPLFTGA